MTITDGALVFGFCVLAFALGYVLGAIRIGRHVDKRLREIVTNVQKIEAYSHHLHQFYSRLGENTAGGSPEGPPPA